MECPVCFERDAVCQFTCSHSFCYACVKTWYQKGSSTCPMCRTNMCFAGVRHAKREWDLERREKILESVVDEILNDPEDLVYGVDMLEFMYDRFNAVIRYYPSIDDWTLDYILRHPWIYVDVERVRIFHEVPTYMEYIMISKTSYGVKMK